MFSGVLGRGRERRVWRSWVKGQGSSCIPPVCCQASIATSRSWFPALQSAMLFRGSERLCVHEDGCCFLESDPSMSGLMQLKLATYKCLWHAAYRHTSLWWVLEHESFWITYLTQASVLMFLLLWGCVYSVAFYVLRPFVEYLQSIFILLHHYNKFDAEEIPKPPADDAETLSICQLGTRANIRERQQVVWAQGFKDGMWKGRLALGMIITVVLFLCHFSANGVRVVRNMMHSTETEPLAFAAALYTCQIQHNIYFPKLSEGVSFNLNI